MVVQEGAEEVPGLAGVEGTLQAGAEVPPVLVVKLAGVRLDLLVQAGYTFSEGVVVALALPSFRKAPTGIPHVEEVWISRRRGVCEGYRLSVGANPLL